MRVLIVVALLMCGCVAASPVWSGQNELQTNRYVAAFVINRYGSVDYSVTARNGAMTLYVIEESEIPAFLNLQNFRYVKAMPNVVAYDDSLNLPAGHYGFGFECAPFDSGCIIAWKFWFP